MTNRPNASEWLTLALLKRPQGRKGELLAELLTDFPERFTERPLVFLAAPGFQGAAEEARVMTVTDSWLPVGRNIGRIVLAFAGIDTIEQAATLAGLEVVVPFADRLPLDDGASYISDLIGCTVIDCSGDTQTPIGVIEAVDFPTTADGSRRLDDVAPLLTVIDSNSEEILLPFAQDFIVSISTTSKIIHMVLPEGLRDLNKVSAVDDSLSSSSAAKKTKGNHFVD